MLYTIYITVQPFNLFDVAMATYNKYIYIYIYEHEAIQKPISENNIGRPKNVKCCHVIPQKYVNDFKHVNSTGT